MPISDISASFELKMEDWYECHMSYVQPF
ncbi:hypothetical protein V6N13_010662 [Hibiscus sabdariffa]